MDWTKIAIAIFCGIMVIALLPVARHMYKESPEAKPGDWGSVLVPIMLVIAFVALLIYFV